MTLDVKTMETVHTPQGRFRRTRFPGRPVLECGHLPDVGTVEALARVNGKGSLPSSLCFGCMQTYMADFAAGGRS